MQTPTSNRATYKPTNITQHHTHRLGGAVVVQVNVAQAPALGGCSGAGRGDRAHADRLQVVDKDQTMAYETGFSLDVSGAHIHAGSTASRLVFMAQGVVVLTLTAPILGP